MIWLMDPDINILTDEENKFFREWNNYKYKQTFRKMDEIKVIETINEALNNFNHIVIENQFLADLVDNFQGFRGGYNREHAIGFGCLLKSVKDIYNPALETDLEVINIMLATIEKITEINF